MALSDGLRACGIFRGLSDPDLDAVAGEATIEQRAAGELIVREGDPADAMFLLLAGAVQVFLASDGREIVLARIDAPDHFGEQALLPTSSGKRS